MNVDQEMLQKFIAENANNKQVEIDPAKPYEENFQNLYYAYENLQNFYVYYQQLNMMKNIQQDNSFAKGDNNTLLVVSSNTNGDITYP